MLVFKNISVLRHSYKLNHLLKTLRGPEGIQFGVKPLFCMLKVLDLIFSNIRKKKAFNQINSVTFPSLF